MKDYGTLAADWWGEKITEENLGYEPKNLNSFKEILTNTINYNISLNAHMIISTYLKGDKNLERIALTTNMCANIPSGYEMGIYYGTGLSVYDKFGNQVFSC